MAQLSDQEKRRLLRELLTQNGASQEKTALHSSGPQQPAPAQDNQFAPLSFAQESLWFFEQLHPASAAYNLSFVAAVGEAIDPSLLERSIEAVISRHKSLRTRFADKEGRPVQIVSSTSNFSLHVEDVSGVPRWGRENEVRKRIDEEARRPFDLTAGPLFRIRLLRSSANELLLLLTVHHIISDGWSIGILVQEVTAFYHSFLQREPVHLPELELQYVDFALQQRQCFENGIPGIDLKYWKKALSDAPAALDLPADLERPAVTRNKGDIVAFRWDDAQRNEMKAFSQAEGVTAFMFLLAAWFLLLARYSGQSDLVIGSPAANRNRRETEPVIGFFANPLPLRVQLGSELSVREFLTRVRQTCLGAYSHGSVPFEKLAQEFCTERSLNRHPLFQVMFVLQNFALAALQSPLLKLSSLPVHTGTAKFDLTLVTYETEDGVCGELEYDTGLWMRDTTSRMLEHWKIMAHAMTANPHAAIAELSCISDAEKQQVLVTWNDSEAHFTERALVHRLFETQAKRFPENIALIQEGRQLKYAELNQSANQVARKLRLLGVRPETKVGVCAERSAEMITGLLGILKAGGVYVPIDPSHPESRIATVISEASISLVLTQRHIKTPWPQGLNVCFLEDECASTSGSQDNLPDEASSDNLAYVIYTSGSTGTPRGVMVPHAGLSNTLLWRRSQFKIVSSDRVLQNIAVGFDPSLWQIFGALISGAALVLVRHDAHRNIPYLLQQMVAHQVTIADFPPSLLQELLEFEDFLRCRSLRTVFVGGEALSGALRDKCLKRLPVELCNMYGPTETSIDATWWKCGEDNQAAWVPIGKPVANKRIYLLDQQLEPVPSGVGGEIVIAGEGLARGYLGHAGVTAEKFVPDPFSAAPGSRMYRTGDRGRHTGDGSLQFLGRLDRQVKIRGLRIELGEIEHVLARHSTVSDCAVLMAPRHGENRLVVFAAGRDAEPPEADTLRGYLRTKLPDYMVPAVYVILERLPRNAAGKLDRERLPLPDESANSLTDLVSPRSQMERRIAEVWQEVLAVPTVGIHNNFFDIGGHSLLLLRVQRGLSEVLGKQLTAVELFQYPTIHGLAQYLVQRSADQPKPDSGSGKLPIEREAAEHWAAPRSGDCKIAVIGMAGRFPAARDLHQFWSNLRDGIEAVTFFTAEELEAAGVSRAMIEDPRYIRSRAVLENVECFDAEFFGFTPREAELLDPQQRIFLQCAWHALEDAGYDPKQDTVTVGVYASLSPSTYRQHNLSHLFRDDATRTQIELGNERDFFGTRVSYKLNLKGPSLTVQTACSSSLVALHMACQALLARQCDMVLAGGATIRLPQVCGYLHNEGGIASGDGHCRAFDASASGTIAGSGAGVVVLKRLSDALAAGDRIDAVILGSAINNDGANKIGYTAPSVEGQAQVIAAAQAMCGVPPGSITYVEAHGTATRLGDPIEIAALSKAFRASTDRQGFCALGSVKTNIGHLDAAAGIAGFIKTVLALRHRQLPPSLHFQRPNPEIDFTASPFYVNAKLTDWNVESGSRRAGVSSFGIGGTNVHMVLEEAPEQKESTAAQRWELLTMSARSEAGLDQTAQNLARHLDLRPESNLADVAFTCQVGRHAFAHRAVVVCESVTDAADLLASRDRARFFTDKCEAERRPVVFLFPGQGSQYPEMGRGLYETEPLFRREMDSCAELLEPHLHFDLRDVLYRQPDTKNAEGRLQHTSVTQPALFAIEYALARLWMAWGVKPDAMAGHSIGEYVAACLAGVMTKEDALNVVSLRGRLMENQPHGAMIAVHLAEAEVEPMLTPGLSVAAVNSPKQVVVAGRHDQVAHFEREITEQGITSSRLRTSHAFHSSMMDPVLETFRRHLATVTLRAPRIPFISNLSGQWISAEQATSPEYWTRHLRGTVRFSETIAELLAEPSRLFLEVGPGRTLQTMVRTQCEHGRHVLGSLRHREDSSPDLRFLLNTAGRLWLSGVEIDWPRLYEGQQRRRMSLPGYPFEPRKYWIEPGLSQTTEDTAMGVRREINDWFYAPAWNRSVRPVAKGLPSSEAAHYILFMDSGGLGSALARNLDACGRKVTCVRPSTRFQQDADAYTIDPARPEHYDALLSALAKNEDTPLRFVHLSSVNPDPCAQADSLKDGFDSLLYLAQTLARSPRTSLVHLFVVTLLSQEVTGTEALRPINATLTGPCRAIQQEIPGLICTNIDIADPLDPHTLDLLQDLLLAPSRDNPMVALRNGYCWVPAFERLQMSEHRGVERLRDRGAYLITGGLGGIGVEMAAYLARTVHARLALLSRRGFPPRQEWDAITERAASEQERQLAQKIHRIRSLEAAGSEVMVLAADCTDPSQMSSAIAQVRRRFGTIHGVLHAAGVTGGELMEATTPAAARRVMAPKIEGTRVLWDLLGQSELDFLVLFSSLSVYAGGIGRADYSSANAFMDAFALAHRGKGPLTISINWDAWQQTGMGAEDADAQKVYLHNKIRPHEGAEAFRCALSLGIPRIVVSVEDFNGVIVRALGAFEDPIQRDRAKANHARPAGLGARAPARNQMEETLVSLWEELLGIHPIGIEDDFHTLGGDSLLASQIVSRIRRMFDAALPLRTFFEGPTISRIALAIVEQQARSSSDGDVEEMLAQLEKLSDQDAEQQFGTL